MGRALLRELGDRLADRAPPLGRTHVFPNRVQHRAPTPDSAVENLRIAVSEASIALRTSLSEIADAFRASRYPPPQPRVLETMPRTLQLKQDLNQVSLRNPVRIGNFSNPQRSRFTPPQRQGKHRQTSILRLRRNPHGHIILFK